MSTKTTISRGASSKFVSRRKCIIWRLLAILRFAHDRPMLRTGPNPRSCGGKSLSRTHAAANREFDDDDDACCLAALWLHIGAGGRPFVPISVDYGDEHDRSSSQHHVGTHRKETMEHMLPKELRTVATQFDPIPEVPEHETGSCKCWSGLHRLFSLRWHRPRELSCLLDEFFTPQ